MVQDKKRCIVCGKEREMTDAICDQCKAEIRGEAVDKQKQIKKDSDKELRREGETPKK